MALESQIYIGWQNDLESVIPTSSIAADANHPIANMLLKKKGKPTRWDMTGQTTLTLTGSSATQYTATGLLIKRHNMLSDSTGRLRLYAGEAEAGALNYDSAEDCYANLPGASGDYFSTPDSVANSITGDMEVILKAAANDWTPATPQHFVIKNAGAGNKSFRFTLETTGLISFVATSDGTNDIFWFSTMALPVSNGQAIWIKMSFDSDNGAGGATVLFYTSSDYDPDGNSGTWTQLGNSVTKVGTGGIFDSSTSLLIGHQTSGFVGKIYRAQIRNGIDGVVVVDFDPRRWNEGDSTFGSETGETWTINGSATVEYTGKAISVAVPWNEVISGIDALGGYYDEEGNLDPVFEILCDNHYRWKSYRIDLKVPSPVNNILEWDKAALFFAWPPEEGYDQGSTEGVKERSEHYENGAGGVDTVPGPSSRRLDLNFSMMDENYANVLTHILAVRARKEGDLYIICDPNAVGYTKYLTTSIYKRENNSSRQRIVYLNQAVTLVEN